MYYYKQDMQDKFKYTLQHTGTTIIYRQKTAKENENTKLQNKR